MEAKVSFIWQTESWSSLTSFLPSLAASTILVTSFSEFTYLMHFSYISSIPGPNASTAFSMTLTPSQVGSC